MSQIRTEASELGKSHRALKEAIPNRNVPLNGNGKELPKTGVVFPAASCGRSRKGLGSTSAPLLTVRPQISRLADLTERPARLISVMMGLIGGRADRISPCWHWVGCCHARVLGSFSALKPSLSHPAPRRLTRGIARELGHLQAFGGVL
jgi:hypothetical protein